MRREAPMADVCWISWKLNVGKHYRRLDSTRSRSYKSEQKTSIAFATAFENKTVRQTLVKTVFLQSEFGMRAARCKRSRRASQKMNIGIRATLTTNRAMLAGREM